jgi:hypothetical protein
MIKKKYCGQCHYQIFFNENPMENYPKWYCRKYGNPLELTENKKVLRTKDCEIE